MVKNVAIVFLVPCETKLTIKDQKIDLITNLSSQVLQKSDHFFEINLITLPLDQRSDH